MRINLFFPDDHVISKFPKEERAKQVKAMIEFSLIHKERVEKLEKEIKQLTHIVSEQSKKLDKILDLLQSGTFEKKEEDEENTNILSKSDIMLIDQMVNLNKR